MEVQSIKESRFQMAQRTTTGTVVHKFEGKRYPEYRKGQCACCGKELPTGQIKFCSEECCDQYVSEPPAMSFREKVTWDRLKRIVLDRDGYECQECLKRGIHQKAKDVHHVVPIYLGGAEFEPGNCISLCGEHHKMLHRALPIARVKRSEGSGSLTKKKMVEYWGRLEEESE
jgi:hypothetical protein